jgi:hypothetical protein
MMFVSKSALVFALSPPNKLFSVTCHIFRATGANCFRSVDNRTLFSFHSVLVEIKSREKQAKKFVAKRHQESKR